MADVFRRGASASPVGRGLALLWLSLGAALMLFPFLWMLATAFKGSSDVFGLALIPPHPTLENLRHILTRTLFARWFWNSAVVALITTASVAIFDSLVGYVLAKVRFPGRELIFVLILSSIMVPTEMLVIPWYMLAAAMGWLDTYWGIMFPGVMSAFGVFLMRQFMQGIPDDLLDAARIDGLGELGIWWRVALPQVRSSLAALCILTFLGSWNAFLWPVIAVESAEMRTIPVGLSFFATELGPEWHLIMAGAALAVVPVLVVFIVFQRQIIRGVALTGLKG